MFKWLKNFIQDFINLRNLKKDLISMSPNDFTEKWFSHPTKIEDDIKAWEKGKTDFLKIGDRQTGKTYYVKSLISYLVLHKKLDTVLIMSFNRDNATKIMFDMLNDKLHYLLLLLGYKQIYKSKEKIIYEMSDFRITFKVETFSKDFGRGNVFNNVFLFADEIRLSPHYNLFSISDDISRTISFCSNNWIFYETIGTGK